jgi:hypothetical protein
LIATSGASPGTRLITKYTYSGSAFTTGTQLVANLCRGGAVSSATYALFALGGSSSPGTATTNKYAYGTDVTSAGTDLASAVFQAAACGNVDVGVFSIGSTVTTTTKYLYASDSVAAGGTRLASINAFGNPASGIGTTGLFDTSSAGVPNKYHYADDTVSSGSAWVSSPATAIGCSLSNGVQDVTMA